VPEAAELYNAMNPWSGRSDGRFYLDLVLGAESVLDVGCGTETLLAKAREAGHTGRLVGFDPDADMLAQAPAGLELVHGDLSTLHWDNEFDLAVMTGHAFQLLLTDADVLTTLRGVRADIRFPAHPSPEPLPPNHPLTSHADRTCRREASKTLM
jgi:SAM-dependent methyltransferase